MVHISQRTLSEQAHAGTFGSSITQQRVRLLPCLDAVLLIPAANGRIDADVGSRRPPQGAGSGEVAATNLGQTDDSRSCHR